MQEKSVVKSIGILGAAVLCCVAMRAGWTQTRLPWKGPPYFMATRGAKVSETLQDIGANYGVPIIVSAQVEDYFTGTIRNEMPDAILRRFAQLFNLATYYDGQALYVYKGDEVKSQIITPRYLGTDRLIHYLTHGGIAAQQYCALRKVGQFNALEVFGVPKCIDRVTELAKNLDEKVLDQAQNQETVQIFPLRFASAADSAYAYRGQQVRIPGVVSVLRDMIQSRSPAGENMSGEAAGPVMPANLMTNVLPSFSADSRQNAVVVRDRKVNMPLYAKLIEQLDQRPVQIEISVAIIDVDASNLSELGVDWSAAANLGRFGSVSFNSNPAKKEGMGMFSTILSDTPSFLVRLNALQQNSKAKILSRPSVVTLNNMQAVLDNNITFYTKLEGEKAVKLESVVTGSLLRVTPRLIENENEQQQIMLTLNIQDGSQLKPVEGSREGLPQIKNSEISTQATLEAGQSLLLGGFVQNAQRQGENKIPLLGDIPVLGHLFRSKRDSTHNVVRLFLIKAQPQLDRADS
ncbi:Type III secretion system EscC protein [Candidatus Glomeribacter gigasporarum BEG34]|uniref:Type 3 secretion system secretin n=1 Tax=Candidatus Glomeribacter gigasporarum BEG34 TaxID=1070319 RepID=G2J8Z5_9BURK|nr:EscC/YscC/HrcC family type III secretion system outer membrane ring protein [Candidatus Glomeribacter gigasporarum]CCD29242.1 Type III secretion system EscC protein [Candidatus Glomeribacter gigasporarum BEG34]